MGTSNVADKVVVITGASSGIGESIAKLLARQGAKVVIGARRKNRIDAGVKEILAAGGKAVGYTPEDAVGVARKLLPDILSYDPRGPARSPHNGRTLTDVVVDVFFSMLTNGKVTGDKVGPHSDLLDGFPYLGPPHGFTPKGMKENL